MTAVRDMRWWDIESVEALELDLFPHTAWTPAQFWAELAQDTRRYVVAEDADGITGYAGLFVLPPTADVQTIAVARRAQGQGLGALLMRRLLALAAAEGCTEMLLEVHAANEAAVALYERHGFERISTRRSYYGPGQDALIMRRRPLGGDPS